MTRANGTTLVEIMLAVSILALTILPIAGLLNYSNRGTREQDAEGIAANLAKEEMNRLLFVIDKATLVGSAGTPTTWSFGAAHLVKGNVFAGEYTVYKHTNNLLNFSIPKMKFHDPQGCANGAEANTSILDTPESRTIEDIYPAIGETLIDIKLVVRWRLPSGTFDTRKEFTLLARRAFLVKN